MIYLYFIFGFLGCLFFLNRLSYHYLKRKIIYRQKWRLNISCGKIDGGGINADIVQHVDLPNFVLIKDIYNLPFKDKEFETVLSSHTIEHIDDPKRFFYELKRVGKSVTVIVPPLWDLFAVLNFCTHKWIVISFKKEHKNSMPLMVPYPLGFLYDRLFNQVIMG